MSLLRKYLTSFLLLVTVSSISAGNLEITDRSSSHIHKPGEPFSISLENKGNSLIGLHWVDFQGQALSTNTTLKPGEKIGLLSPSDKIGYYGLRINDQQGLRETGFAILEPRTVEHRTERAIKNSSPFGMVHTDNNDPYMDVWTKTATWDTYDVGYWYQAMEERRKLGLSELPIISGEVWESDDIAAITMQKLAELKSKLIEYFNADPHITYWELGIEENINKHYREPFYWKNLLAKVKIAQVAAIETNRNIRFTYQIAGRNPDDIERFLKHPSARFFHVLALHPYPWPAFENADDWLNNYLTEVGALQKKYNTKLPIWFTEIGAPQHINPEGGMFNFGKAQNVRGHSRREASRFMARLSTIALHSGVEKLFWYNYHDRGNLNADPENFFGIKDYDGFPKPSYLTFHLLSDRLHNAKPEKSLTLSNRVQTYRFSKRTETCTVAWSADDNEYDVDVTSLLGKQATHYEALNMTGGELPQRAASIKVGIDPVIVCSLPAPNSN